MECSNRSSTSTSTSIDRRILFSCSSAHSAQAVRKQAVLPNTYLPYISLFTSAGLCILLHTASVRPSPDCHCHRRSLCSDSRQSCYSKCRPPVPSGKDTHHSLPARLFTDYPSSSLSLYLSPRTTDPSHSFSIAATTTTRSFFSSETHGPPYDLT